MKEENKLAIIIGYYLFRFDEIAYKKLGYKNKTETHNKIAKIIGAKPLSIKGFRDEFDPYYSNNRAGWHNRDAAPSRLEIMDKYKDKTEEKMFEIVSKILENGKATILFFDKIDKQELSNEDQQNIEGDTKERKFLSYKRNQKNVNLCKERDKYTCKVCNFHLDNKIVECHHLKPLHITKKTIVKIDDLVTLCPTCHKIAHMLIRNNLPNYQNADILIKEIKKLLESNKASQI